MGKFDELMARKGARDAEAEKARRARDDDEAEEIEAALLEDESYILIRVPDSPPELVGSVVARVPKEAEVANYRHTMWRESAEKGVVEAKAKAGLKLAAMCRVWPDEERYSALIHARSLVADSVAKACVRAAEAAADSESKG